MVIFVAAYKFWNIGQRRLKMKVAKKRFRSLKFITGDSKRERKNRMISQEIMQGVKLKEFDFVSSK